MKSASCEEQQFTMTKKSSHRRNRYRLPSTSSLSSTNSSANRSSSSGTSNDVSESTSEFTGQLYPLGLRVRSISPDGNCLFSTFADQLYGKPHYHPRLRKQAVEYLSKHKREIKPFLGNTSYSAMLNELAESGTYGDHLSIVALARVKHVDVIVHRIGEQPRLVAQGCSDPQSCSDSTHRQVHLALDSEHYSSVRSIDGPSQGPANILLDLRRLEKNAAKSHRRHRYHSECTHNGNYHHHHKHRQRSSSGQK
nr:OTU domain containing protein 3 [Hymenolepis microstoma]